MALNSFIPVRARLHSQMAPEATGANKPADSPVTKNLHQMLRSCSPMFRLLLSNCVHTMPHGLGELPDLPCPCLVTPNILATQVRDACVFTNTLVHVQVKPKTRLFTHASQHYFALQIYSTMRFASWNLNLIINLMTHRG